jgi:uncharacterized protein DUF3263
VSEELDERWRDVLDFERTTENLATGKVGVIRDRFGLSPAGYYQLLNRLIDRPEALEYDPMLVQRLRRLRETRRRVRFGRAGDA